MAGTAPAGFTNRSTYDDEYPLAARGLVWEEGYPVPITQFVQARPTPGLKPGSLPSSSSRCPQQPEATALVHATLDVVPAEPPQPSSDIHP
jgi:hypothetical protein